MFVARLGECPRDPDATAVVAKTALGDSAKYGKVSGFQCCASRLGGSTTRASLFSLDLPRSGATPERFLDEVLFKKCMARQLWVQHYRLADAAPSAFSPQGSLNAGCVFRFAARASALVLSLVDVRSLPTTNRANEAMATEVVANALRGRDCQIVQGSVEQQNGPRTSTQALELNSAYDCIAGAYMIGIVETGPGDQMSMLRFTISSTARGVGEVHMAFAPDSFPRATKGGCFLAQAAVSERDRARVYQELVSECGALC